MPHRFFIFVSMFATLAFSCSPAEAIDRIVATVNGHIILLTDWEDSLRFEAFSSGRSLERFTAEERKAVLNRLIDQELLGEQRRSPDIQHAPPGEVEQRVAEIRKQYPGPDNELGWRTVLQRYRLSEEGLKARVATELDLMRLVDARLRPS